MPVLRQVPRSEVTDENVKNYYNKLFGDRDPVTEPGTSTGTPGDWWSVFALQPDIFKHCTDGFGVYRNPNRTLDPILRELGQTRAGWNKSSQFVFSQHCKSLRGLGVSEEKIAAIPYWTVATCYDDEERAVLAYTDCLSNGGRVPDEIFTKLREFMGDEEILQFTYITCLYDMHAVMSRALRVEWDDRKDPIVEIAAPASFNAVDFLGDSRKPDPAKKQKK